MLKYIIIIIININININAQDAINLFSQNRADENKEVKKKQTEELTNKELKFNYKLKSIQKFNEHYTIFLEKENKIKKIKWIKNNKKTGQIEEGYSIVDLTNRSLKIKIKNGILCKENKQVKCYNEEYLKLSFVNEEVKLTKVKEKKTKSKRITKEINKKNENPFTKLMRNVRKDKL